MTLDEAFDGYGGLRGWLLYAERHYLPVLEGKRNREDTERLMGFFHDDVSFLAENMDSLEFVQGVRI